MTKKTENYKNLLRKQTQANRRRAKHNPATTAMVTSSTTIETTLVTKVTSSNTIISSTSQQMLGHTATTGGEQVCLKNISFKKNISLLFRIVNVQQID